MEKGEKHKVEGVKFDSAAIVASIEQGEPPAKVAAEIENLDTRKFSQILDAVKGNIATATEAVKPLFKTVKKKARAFIELQKPLPSVAELLEEARIQKLTEIAQMAMERFQNEPPFEVQMLSEASMKRLGLDFKSTTAAEFGNKPEEVHTYQAVSFEELFGKSQAEMIQEIKDWESANADWMGRKVG